MAICVLSGLLDYSNENKNVIKWNASMHLLSSYSRITIFQNILLPVDIYGYSFRNLVCIKMAQLVSLIVKTKDCIEINYYILNYIFYFTTELKLIAQ